MCDFLLHSSPEVEKSPSPACSNRTFFFCTPTSSRIATPSSSCSSDSSSDSFYGSSPHQVFTSFFISPIRCSEYVLKSTGPTRSMLLFSPSTTSPSRKRSSEVLGSGGFGSVVISSYNKRAVALKKVPSTGCRQQRLLSSELLAFLVPASPYVVSALGFSVVDNAFHVVSELIDGGNLQSLIDDEEYVMDCELKMDAIHQICLALAHCHASAILHLDVKPANVLFVKATRSFKLADFGCSIIGKHRTTIEDGRVVEMVECTDPSRIHGGTIAYQAPEIFKKAGVTCRSDVYSLAMCAWHILTGTAPFFGHHPHFIVYTVVSNHARPDIDRIVSPFTPLRPLLRSLWSSDALARPSTQELLQQLAAIPIGDDV